MGARSSSVWKSHDDCVCVCVGWHLSWQFAAKDSIVICLQSSLLIFSLHRLPPLLLKKLLIITYLILFEKSHLMLAVPQYESHEHTPTANYQTANCQQTEIPETDNRQMPTESDEHKSSAFLATKAETKLLAAELNKTQIKKLLFLSFLFILFIYIRLFSSSV